MRNLTDRILGGAPRALRGALIASFAAAAFATAADRPPKNPAKPAEKPKETAAKPAALPAGPVPAKPVPSAAAAATAASTLPATSPVKVRWAVDLPDRKAIAFFLPPAAAEMETVLVATDKDDLLAVERRTGMVAWWTRLPGPLTGAPCFSKEAVYLVSKSALACLERNSGEVIWRINLPFPPSGGPAVFEETPGKPLVFVPGLDAKVYACEIDKTVWPNKFGSGAVQQSDVLLDEFILRVAWQYPTFDQITGNLSFSDRYVYAADSLHNVYGLHTAELVNGKLKTVQIFRTQGPLAAEPVAAGPNLYAACRDRNLYCISRSDFRELWRYPSGELLQKSPAVITDPASNRTAVLVKCGIAGPLTALQDTDGKPMWEVPGAIEAVGRFIDPENEADKKSIVVLRNEDGSLSGHAFGSGTRLWTLPAANYGPFCQNTEDEAVFAAINGSTLVSLVREK